MRCDLENQYLRIDSYKVGMISSVASDTIIKLLVFFREHKDAYPDFFEKRGGFLCIMDKKTGAIVGTFLVGSVPVEKAARYLALAPEKATRLFVHINDGHLTSYESRNPDADQWGGAIVGERFIYSFSGYPEDGDSFIVTSTAYAVGDLKEEKREEIIKRSRIGYLTNIPELQKLLQ